MRGHQRGSDHRQSIIDPKQHIIVLDESCSPHCGEKESKAEARAVRRGLCDERCALFLLPATRGEGGAQRRMRGHQRGSDHRQSIIDPKQHIIVLDESCSPHCGEKESKAEARAVRRGLCDERCALFLLPATRGEGGAQRRMRGGQRSRDYRQSIIDPKQHVIVLGESRSPHCGEKESKAAAMAVGRGLCFIPSPRCAGRRKATRVVRGFDPRRWSGKPRRCSAMAPSVRLPAASMMKISPTFARCCCAAGVKGFGVAVRRPQARGCELWRW